MMSFRPPQCPLPLPPVNVRDALPSTPLTPLTTLVQYCTSSAESILSWAEQVQPGTPAPLTPPSDSTTTSASSSTSSLASAPSSGGGKKKTRRPSVSRLHLNLSARRPSGVQHSQARSGSASFMNIIDTPSTGSAQPQPQPARTPMSSKSLNAGSYDLTNLGYTSVFVRLPHTPATPAHLINATYNNTTTPANPNASTSNLNQRDDSGGVKRTLNRIRSFSILRRVAQPKTPPPVPALPSDIPPVPPMPAIFSKSSSFNKLPSSPTVAVQKKKDMYPVTKAKKDTKVAPKKTKTPLPPTLASELALIQFLDGGNMDEAIQRVMDAQAKASLPAGRTESKETRAHGVVYRDENGGVWMDKDEEMEYKHLLATSPTISSPSASSPGLSTPGHPSSPFLMCANWIKFESTSPTKENSAPPTGVSFHRRGASFSLTMHEVKPAEEEGLHGQFVRLPALIAAAPSTGDARTSRRPRTPGSPSKSKRYGMIYERSKSRVSGRPRRGTVTSIVPESSLSSACTSESSDDDRRYATSATSLSTSSTSARKVRRRPAPLALVPPSSSFAGKARKEFLDESFAPAPPLPATHPASAGLGSFVDVGLAISVVPPPRGSSLPVPGDDFAMVVDKAAGGMMRSVKKKASRMALWRK